MGLFWDAVASFIDYYEVVKESRLKFVRQKKCHSATRTDPVHYQTQEAVFHPTSRHRDAGRKKTLERSYALINETFILTLYCYQIVTVMKCG